MINDVTFIRPDYKNLHAQWKLIADCLEGETRIKAGRTLYLPKPNPSDTSTDNELRYNDYLTRAVFYNVTRRTIEGLVGLVFQRDPVVELPTGLKGLETNADGGGVNLTQLGKDGLLKGVAFGKCALLVDYPHADKPLTVAEIEMQGIQPSISVYNAMNIINWKTAVIGGKKKLVLAVLLEEEVTDEPGSEFATRTRTQYRVLRLTEGVYTQQLYLNDGAEPQQVRTPVDFDAKPFDEIPLFAIGSKTNTFDPTPPPAYDLATINVAHYRNSADYEESVYVIGQPTLLLSGLSEQWVKNVFEGNPVSMGSRAAVALPEHGRGEILQAQPNSLAKEAMEAKEAQMVALGARLVSDNTGTEKTATQSRYDQANADSVLSNTAQNVNDAFNEALAFACRFTGDDASKIKFDLNTEFDLTKLSAEEIKTIIEAWQKNAITGVEMRDVLIRAGMAKLDYEEYQKEVANDVALTAENTKVINDALIPPDDGAV